MRLLLARSLPAALSLLLVACAPTSVPPGDSPDAGDTGNTARAASGAPCTKDEECAGTSPKCLTTDAAGHVFPGGACTSACEPSASDAFDGSNSGCPGRAHCSGVLESFLCLAGCEGGDCREGYTCALTAGDTTGSIITTACIPTSLTCDPATPRAGCASDKVCVSTPGPEPIGNCVAACDLFSNTCGDGKACYPLAEDASGACAKAGSRAAGDPCDSALDCAAGSTCVTTPAGNRCRPLCGGPGNVACDNSRTCTSFGGEIPVSVVGFCN